MWLNINRRRRDMDECVSNPSLLEQALEYDNMRAAAERVISNKGAPGTDKMTVRQLLPYLEKHYEELVEQIRNGGYRPKPVRRVEIPKPDGGVRLLGVPSVVDRMVQQAVAQVIVPIYEPLFSDHSYGFRPERSAHDAVKEAKEYFSEGYNHVVDIDLAKYFDSICHDKLMSMLREVLDDKALRELICKFLKSGVMIGGLVSPTTEGAPQGGPISPVLSNIYLTKFDRMLESRGLKFVRYADDCNIYVKSRRAADRVMKSATSFLEGTLKLKVNQDKSKVGSPTRLKFLGFAMWKINGKSGIRVHEKSLKRFKDKVRRITRRNRGRSVETVFKEFETYAKGWLGYYRLASLVSKLGELDGWVRARSRAYIWKQWKRTRTKAKNLRKLGIDRETAWMWANTRKGYWRIAHSQVLSKSLTNKYLEERGLLCMLKHFEKVKLVS
ncbi:MAG: group II intron reverse transcriptase/maturase [Deltaproteobacteria bacterium]|jgi:group II intron reverse transcriptase/maturase|nr:group II intron reverse transcriptase/maturase [Deltaproteobacteria bacterium]